MQLKEETLDAMRALAELCRSKNPQKLSDRQATYRRLVQNSIKDALERAYPITKAKLTEQDWDELIADFIAEKPLLNPQIWSMPSALCEYLSESERKFKKAYPFLLDLLNFEWLEVELYMQEDLPLAQCESRIDEIFLNPYRKILALKFPVFREEFWRSANESGQYYLLCLRSARTDEVQYLELNKSMSHFLGELPKLKCPREDFEYLAKNFLGASIDLEQLLAFLKSKEIIL